MCVMKCEYCEQEMTEYEVPVELFNIPFTNLSVWGIKKQLTCESCESDMAQADERDAYNAIEQSIGRQAYEEGFDDGQNTHR